MKKIALALALFASVPAMAHGPHHGYWRHGGGGWNWVAPAIVGGVIGYEIARPPVVVQQPVIVQPQPVPVPQPYIVQGQNCSPWTQIQNPDGTITSTRTCTQ